MSTGVELKPGAIVAGQFEILKCLSVSHHALVYSCRDRASRGALKGLKLLAPAVLENKVLVTRFLNEIVCAFKIRHPHVVHTHECFRSGSNVGYTMELVEGGDLATRLEHSAPIFIAEAIYCLAQLASGLEAIHGAGLVHRDLKPENVLLARNSDPKITDFGVASGAICRRVSDPSGIVGALDYISPEYLEKGEVDARSDIYALGIIGYVMVTRNIPFHAPGFMETLRLRLKTDPVAPRDINPLCSRELNKILLKAIARDPAARFQSAREMREALAELLPSTPLERPDVY